MVGASEDASGLFDSHQYSAVAFTVLRVCWGKVGRRAMSTYHVSFFKTLLSSDGHPFKCLQQRIDISDAGSSAQAVEAASRAFEAFYGCPWKLHADSIEVIAADPQ